MSLETEQSEFNRKSQEAQERAAENKEGKEGEADNELKAGAAMERADVIVKEVKQSKKQMQNIVMHMQTVLTAIRQLRQQLQLAQVDDDVSSVRQDKKQVEELKKKIKEYGEELEKMKGDLIREEIEELKKGVGVAMSADEIYDKAEKNVDELIEQVKN